MFRPVQRGGQSLVHKRAAGVGLGGLSLLVSGRDAPAQAGSVVAGVVHLGGVMAVEEDRAGEGRLTAYHSVFNFHY